MMTRLLLSTSFKTLPTSEYGNIAAARLDGGIERGWVPDYLPESASGLVEFHFIDGGESWLTFLCPASCATTLRELSDTAPRDIAVRSPPAGRLRWPAADGMRDIAPRLRATQQNRDVILIDTADGRAYVWRRSGVPIQ